MSNGNKHQSNNDKSKKINSRKQNIETVSEPSSELLTVVTALTGLIGGIWGGQSAISSTQGSKIDAKTIFAKGQTKKGIAEMLKESSQIINNIAKDSVLFSTDGKKTLQTYFDHIKTISTNVQKIVDCLKTDSSSSVITLNIENMNDLANVIESIGDPQFEPEKFSQFIRDLSDLADMSDRKADIGEYLNNLSSSISKFQGILDNLSQQKDNNVNLLSIMNDLIGNESIVESIEKKQNIIDASTEKLNKIIELGETLHKTLNQLELDETTSKKVTYLTEVLNLINKINIDSKQLSDMSAKIDKLINTVQKFNSIANLDSAIDAAGKTLEKFVKVINDTVDKLDTMAIEKLNKVNEVLNSFARIIIISAAVLIFGALAMTLIDTVNLLTFTGLLTFFIFTTVGSIIVFSSLINDAQDTLKDFAILITASAIILVAGGLLAKVIDVEATMLFAVILAGFMTAVTLPIIILSKWTQQAMVDLAQFALLVIAAGIILIGAGLISKKIDFWATFGFAFILAAFMLGLTAPILILSKPTKQAIVDLAQFAVLVIAAGIIMIGGGLISKKIDILGLLVFTGSLIVFMLALTVPILAFSTMTNAAIAAISEMGVLVLMSAAVLLIGGGLFKKYPWLMKTVPLFAIYLTAFIVIFSAAMWLATQSPNTQAFRSIQMMALLVGITAATMLIGGSLIMNYPELLKTIPEFLFIELVFIGGIAGIAYILSNHKLSSNIKKALLTMLGISAVTLIAAGTMVLMAKLCLKYKWEVLGESVGKLFAFITVTALGYAALGAAAISGSTFLIVAGIALVLINSLTLLTTDVMVTVMNAMKQYNPTALSQFKDVIKTFGEIGAQLDNSFSGMWILRMPFIYKSIRSLASAISLIAEVVKEYADLKVAIYEGTKKVGYRSLRNSDFSKAARNVSKIITTLGGAVMNAYNKNPEIFDADFNLLGVVPVGDSKFTKVVRSLATLGPMLAKIAEGVKDYADLKIPVYEGTKKVGYKHLEKSDFINASNNVKSVIEVLGKAIIESYDAKPELYEEPLIFGRSKFAQVTRSLSKLGPMIANIAEGVKDYADLKIGDEYKPNKDGILKPTKYRHLTDEDFYTASANIQHILSTLGGAVIATYEANPEIYQETGGILGFGARSPFTITIDANIKLGKMIAKIADSVKDYADFKIGEDYQPDKDGILKPTRYRHLNDNDFKNASKNVQMIMETLGGAVIATYKANPNLYKEEGGILGFGASSPFTVTIDANIKLGKMIAKIAKGVKDYADLKIAIYGERGTEPIGYKHLTDPDFKAASENVQKIMETLGGAIIRTYKANRYLYDETGGIFGFGGSSPFERTIDANMKLGKLISEIGKGVKDMASGRIATNWDPKTGRPTKYEQLGPTHFAQASVNIGLILTTLGQTIMNTYKSKPEWFEDGEDSTFAQACTAIGSMGNMINNIAQGIQGYADLKIPQYDEKGQISGYKPITPETFTEADKHIMLIVSTLGQTVINTYKEHPEWFRSGENSEFNVACKAIGNMGEMIGQIATGIQSYAELKFPIKWDESGKPIDFKVLSGEDITNAGNNIKTVITIIGEAVKSVYTNNSELFKVDPNTNPDGLFANVVEGCSAFGELISSIAEGIQAFAELRMPTGFDKNGKATGWTKMGKTVFTDARDNISQIISFIGTAIMATFNGHKDWFDSKTLLKSFNLLGIVQVDFKPDSTDPPFIRAVQGCMMMGELISKIALGIQDFANLYVPVYDPNTHQIIGKEKISEGVFKDVREKIGMIICTLGQTLVDEYEKHKEYFDDLHLLKVTKFCIDMGTMISGIAKGIQSYANLVYPIAWNEKGVPTNYKKLTNEELIKAGQSISTVMTTVAKAILNIANDPTFNRVNSEIIANIMKAMSKTGTTLVNVASAVKSFARMEFLTWDYSDPDKPKKIVEVIKPGEIKQAIENIKLVIKAIGTALLEVCEEDTSGLFGKNIFNSPAYMAAKSTASLGALINQISRTIGFFAKSIYPVIEYRDGKLETVAYFELRDEEYGKAETNIKRVLTAIANAVMSVFNEHPELITISETSSIGIFKNLSKNIEVLSESINNMATALNKLPNESDFNADKLVQLKDKIIQVISTSASITSAMVLSNTLSVFGDDYVNSLFDSTDNIATFIDKISIILNKTSSLRNVDALSTLSSIVTDYAQILNILRNIFIYGNEILSNDDNLFQFAYNNESWNPNEIMQQINFFSDEVGKIISLSQLSKDTGPEGLNYVAQGVKEIDESMSSLKSFENFSKHNVQLDKYVKTVNKIDIRKVNNLTGLVKAMNSLASRMGNVDQLTSAIADRLSVTLDRLTTEMQNAAKVVKESEKIQAKRHEAIERSALKLSDIMKQKLTVEVKQVTDNDPLDGDDTYDGGTDTDKSSPNTQGAIDINGNPNVHPSDSTTTGKANPNVTKTVVTAGKKTTSKNTGNNKPKEQNNGQSNFPWQQYPNYTAVDLSKFVSRPNKTNFQIPYFPSH